jgi:hypothetical protein
MRLSTRAPAIAKADKTIGEFKIRSIATGAVILCSGLLVDFTCALNDLAEWQL